MKNYVVGTKEILKKEQVLISIFLIAILVLSSGSMVAFAKSNTIVVKPSGSDDTANIQTALNSCASPNPPCTVQLLAGTYIISSQIAVTGFQGRFVGMGQGQTKIEALGNMPGTAVTPYWAVFPPANPWPSLFTFVDGSFTMAGMTITDTSPTPTKGWTDITGGCSETPCTALTEAIKVTGLKSFATFDHITIVGSVGDYGGYNIAEGIHIEGLELPLGWTNPEADTHMLTGTFSITNSVFTDTAGPIVNFLVNSNVAICGNVATTPDIDNYFVFDIVTDVSNTNVLICRNQGTIPIQAAVAVYQSAIKPGLLPSTVTVTDNNFQLSEGANGAYFADFGEYNFGTPPTMTGIVLGNSFQNTPSTCPPIYCPIIASVMLKSVIVSMNSIQGGGSPGIYVYNQPGIVVGNSINGASTGVWVDAASGVHVMGNIIKSSTQFGISVTSETPLLSNNNLISGNFVHGSGLSDLYWDGQGTGNGWCHNIYQTSDPSVLPSC